MTDGQALNPYAYVYNDPVNLVDPSGNVPGAGDIGNAIGDGIGGGVIAAGAFAAATAFGAPALVAVGLSFGVGWLWSEFVARPAKEKIFATDPRYG